MQIDDALLSKLERLSMLHIDENRREDTQVKLGEILDFVENLSNVKVEADITHEAQQTPLREDKVSSSHISDDVLAHAPHAQDRFFIVPKIIE